ncbi:unnamed protein product, partial [Amoebophrya sp. A25]
DDGPGGGSNLNKPGARTQFVTASTRAFFGSAPEEEVYEKHRYVERETDLLWPLLQAEGLSWSQKRVALFVGHANRFVA